MVALQFVVDGVPQVQGNHRVGRGKFAKIYDANPQLPHWREQVKYEAASQAIQLDHRAFTGPVRLEVVFWLHRPLSAPKTQDVLPITRGGGDWDKLARAIGDSLVDAGVLRDDSQIVAGCVEKFYAVGPHLPKIYLEGFHRPTPGALITVSDLPRIVMPTMLDHPKGTAHGHSQVARGRSRG